jgi:hypothetical protein
MFLCMIIQFMAERPSSGVHSLSLIPRNHLKILGAKGVKRIVNFTEGPQILGATAQNLFARDIWRPTVMWMCGPGLYWEAVLRCVLKYCWCSDVWGVLSLAEGNLVPVKGIVWFRCFVKCFRVLTRLSRKVPERRRLPERPRHRWEDNIKMNLQEVGCGVWTGLSWLRIGTGGGDLWMR